MATSAPDRLETPRLILRRPLLSDAAAIFERYAGDADVTKYMAWPRHRSVADTEMFLTFSDAEWTRGPAGPYLILSRADGELLGSTGFAVETPERAMTGYVLARNAWGLGYATEALVAMRDLAPSFGLKRLYAICHPAHRASARVLEKGGFALEGTLRQHTVFPNLDPAVPADVLCYARTY